MIGDSVQLVPNIPPRGLREVEERCIVCTEDLERAAVRYPLRLQLSQHGRVLPSLIIGFACSACHSRRRPEVRTAQFAAAQRYLHVRRDH